MEIQEKQTEDNQTEEKQEEPTEAEQGNPAFLLNVTNFRPHTTNSLKSLYAIEREEAKLIARAILTGDADSIPAWYQIFSTYQNANMTPPGDRLFWKVKARVVMVVRKHLERNAQAQALRSSPRYAKNR